MSSRQLLASAFCILIGGAVMGQDYYAYATAESEDEVALIKFDGQRAQTLKRIPVGIWPAEIEGPHGITVGPQGLYWYLSLAHGNPYGTVYKFETGTDKVVGQTQLGLFPASMQISSITGLLYVVNFNLHGDMVPSSVSVVDPVTMTEITRITTGVMPHGSRISPDGLKQYSVGMMSGELFEIDAVELEVNRKLYLDGNSPDNKSTMTTDHANHDIMDHKMMDHGATQEKSMYHSKVKPTWVIPHPDGERVFIAGNGCDQVLEVDLDSWSITRRMEGGKGPYNVEISPDGTRLVVTYKTDGKTGIWDLTKNVEIARVTNSRRVSHGITISSDSRYAFVSAEGIGGESGIVDVIELQNGELIDYAELGKQAGGIAFWKIEHN